MKVVLPDQTELELPDGATGLDAARAIGPKLAEQAVLVRANGNVQDLRLPLEDGQPIQILTTRDTNDPDALYVLRHSTAHLLAEAVRRLYPGVKVAIGPPIENGFYYDFDFPEPIHEEDLARIEAEIAKELAEGREWSREEISRDEAQGALRGRARAVQGAARRHRRGRHLALHARRLHRSLPRAAPAELEADQGAEAHRARRRVLARRLGPSRSSRGSTARPSTPRRTSTRHLERLEEARKRDHRVLGQRLDLFHLSEHSPGSPFWHPKGMVVWNELEDVRRRENLSRGYVEVKTPLLYDVDTYITSGHYENYKENMFFVSSKDESEKQFALKPMNCPGHMLLFGSDLRSYRDLPLRYAESSTLHRDELAGTLHGLLRVRHITQDDAHIFCTRDQIEDEIFGCLDFASYLYELFGLEARFELSTRPEKRTGTDEEWDFTEGALKSALEQRRIDYALNEGDGAFYGPKIDLHMTDVLGRSWQMGTIQLDAIMPQAFGLTYMGPDNHEHTPYVIHRALLGSLERFIGILTEHYGGAFPFWLAPVQIRVLPVGEGHLEPAMAIVERLRRRATGSTSASRPRRSASGSARPSSRRSRSRSSSATGRATQSLAIRERGGEQTEESLADLLEKLATLDS